MLSPKVLDRQFAEAAANCHWVMDITYIWTAEGWMYVAVVLDPFSRGVVGWWMSSQTTAQLLTDATLMAIWTRRPRATLLHHSNQGSQYISEMFQRLL